MTDHFRNVKKMLHTITPPPELVQEWREEAAHRQYFVSETEDHLIEQAAQWGADTELEACCQWIRDDAEALRIARRPKTPSLKEQALSLIDDCTDSHGDDLDDDILGGYLDNNALSIIRRALEALPDD